MIRYAKYSSRAPTAADPEVRSRVRELLTAIETEGTPAVYRYAEQFDRFSPERLVGCADLLDGAGERLSHEVRCKIELQSRQLRTLAEAQLQTITDFAMTLPSGVVVGHRHVPVGSVGVYVPAGGEVSVPAALTATIFAREAGVKRVIASTPPVIGTELPDPAVLFALKTAGAERLMILGGAQAIGALAFGVDDAPGVDMIVGAGNAYVTEAKRQLFGVVGVDTLAGPAECLLIADEHARPQTISRRIVTHLTGGSELKTWLVTTSAALAEAVMDDLETELHGPECADALGAWSTLGDVLVCDTPEEVLEVADGAAARRVELYTRSSAWFIEKLRNYGSIVVNGPDADLEEGAVPNDFPILPTAGAARFSEGLWVGSFLRALSYRLTAGAAKDGSPGEPGLPSTQPSRPASEPLHAAG